VPADHSARQAPTLTADVESVLAGERLADPYPVWERLREEAPVLRVGTTVFVSRFDDVKSLINDSRFSSRMQVTGSRADEIVQSFPEDVRAMWREMADFDSNILLRTEGVVHERLRRIVHPFFTPRSVMQFDAAIQGIVDELLADAAERETYDHRWLAQELALRVVSHVLGSSQIDYPYVVERVDRLARWLGTADVSVVRDAYAARLEFNEYIADAIIAVHDGRPGSSGLVAALIEARDVGDLSSVELMAMISILLAGGIETTSILMSTGLIELLRHRRQWELLTRSSDRVPAAVEELLRFLSPAQWTSRIARSSMDWAGVSLEGGQTMIGVLAAANRDPRVYDDPEELDIERAPHPHLALGFGPHFCLGASLARSEARILFRTLAERYPHIELAADQSDLDWSESNPMLRGVKELPVHLGRARQPLGSHAAARR
jgi:cytochrome P450